MNMLSDILKSKIRGIAASGYYKTGHYKTRLMGKVAILMYHRVLSKKELSQLYVQPGMYVLDDVFEMQMRFLKEQFNIISFNELLSIWNKKTFFDETKRYCVITFDDGWLDNYTNAYQILKKNDIPATIFLPTAYIGTSKWFWPDKLACLLRQLVTVSYTLSPSVLSKYPWLRDFRIEGIESVIMEWKVLAEEEIEERIDELAELLNLELSEERRFLNWQEIEEMSRHKISFGSHSSTHKILTNHATDVVRKEVVDSITALRGKQVNYVNIFCFPNGNYNEETAEIVKNAGYDAAVTTEFGLENGVSSNPFCLKRIGMHNDISSTAPLFAFQLSGISRNI